MELIVNALAAVRLARLIRFDTIAAPARNWLFGLTAWGTTPRSVHRAAWRAQQAIGCPWCVTVWTALVVVVVRRTPARRLVDALAVAELAGRAWSTDPAVVAADR